MTVARCRPPTGRPKAHEVTSDTLKDYKAVSHLLVHGINLSWQLKSDQVEEIWPLLDLFAPDEADRRAQARILFQNVLPVVENLPPDCVHHHQSVAFWKRVLTEPGPFTRKIREREGKNDDGKVQQTVKEFAELLAKAVEQPQLTDEDSEQVAQPSAAVSSRPTDDPAPAMLTVHRSVDPATLSFYYSVSLTGDNLDRWYLDILRAKVNGGPLPPMQVVIVVEDFAYISVRETGRRIRAVESKRDQLREFERVIIETYHVSSDDYIRGICQYAIQYFNHYYRSPELVREVVELVLGVSWVEDNNSFRRKAEIFRTPGPGFGLWLSDSSVSDLAVFCGEEPTTMLYYLLQCHLDFAAYFPQNTIQRQIIPGMISTWFEFDMESRRAIEPDDFFRLGTWHSA
jgi:hypothetical protein